MSFKCTVLLCVFVVSLEKRQELHIRRNRCLTETSAIVSKIRGLLFSFCFYFSWRPVCPYAKTVVPDLTASDSLESFLV